MCNQSIKTYWQQIYAHLRGRCFCAHHTAEDLTQELFTRLAAKGLLVGLGNRFESETELRNYLFAAARNLHRDQHRRATQAKRGGGEPEVSIDALDPDRLAFTAPSDTPVQAAERRELRERWHHEIAALSERIPPQRGAMFALVRDAFLPGEQPLDTHTAATTLGVAPATLRVQLHRWRERLVSRMRTALAA